ncbi:hypothetical protein ICN84_09190 [Akkermansia glycaniphila]|uniref:hypothetical protein n=1 Tax=Akkermansia glycaniphila TaxID=1679444 RepID=UPI001C01AAEE|nr:hypothetical protein [Akkermansia glycaniphila]MBT9450242.1 hypothetical protein [Akkermansia glycaniphila]
MEKRKPRTRHAPRTFSRENTPEQAASKRFRPPAPQPGYQYDEKREHVLPEENFRIPPPPAADF